MYMNCWIDIIMVVVCNKVSRTLLSIQAVLNNAEVWMVSTYPLISNSPDIFTNPLEIVSNTTTTIGHLHVL